MDAILNNLVKDLGPAVYFILISSENGVIKKSYINEEEFKASMKDEGVKELKRHRIIQEVAKLEKIKVTQEEVDKEIKKMAEQQGAEFEQMKEQLRQNGTTLSIRERLKDKKTFDFLLEG